VTRAVDEARTMFAEAMNEAKSNALAARERAETELSKQLDRLRDAIDQALATGIPCAEISAKLGLDRSFAQSWLSEA
jgi:hypothetical protein